MNAIILVSVLALGQCGPGGCRVAPAVSGETYQWHTPTDDPTRRALYLNGRHIGTFDTPSQTYYAIRGDSWRAEDPPISPPGGYGVDFSQVHEDRVTFQGHPIAGGELLDDSKKKRVTVIETDKGKRLEIVEKCKQIFPDAGVRGYAPDHWHLSPGFVTTPGVYVQDPDGKVTARYRGYGALRKADPKYDAKKDPDPAFVSPASRSLFLPAIVAVGIMFYLVRKQEGPVHA